MQANIIVLAGVNGAGKSSVAGEAIIQQGRDFYNPDKMARSIITAYPGLTQGQANGSAWSIGLEALQKALRHDEFFVFESTLGGDTITQILLTAAQRKKAEITISYVGLDSVERHIQRVQKRVAAGGHDIPKEKIQQRYISSRQNLITLMPYLSSLYVYDNTEENNNTPKPIKLLYMEKQKIKHIQSLEAMPEWAKPIIATALKIDAN